MCAYGLECSTISVTAPSSPSASIGSMTKLPDPQLATNRYRPPGCTDRWIGWAPPLGPRAEQPQLATLADGERAHQPIGQLMDGVQGPSARRHRQKRRIVRTVHRGLEPEHAPTQGRNTDPPPAGSAVAAEVDHRLILPIPPDDVPRASRPRQRPRRRARTARTTHYRAPALTGRARGEAVGQRPDGERTPPSKNQPKVETCSAHPTPTTA